MVMNLKPSFSDLHSGPFPLLLPNAWDVGSALAFAGAGFCAVGTTSMGVSASIGGADARRNSKMATRNLIYQLRDLPAWVNADIEDGYSDDPGEVAGYVANLGAAGINIEDSTNGVLIDPRLHASKISAIKEAAPNVFVNARIETYWLGQDAAIEATLERALAYIDAGADCIFIPGIVDASTLELFASTIPIPLNVLASSSVTLDQLSELGIRRLSTGSLPYRAAIEAAVSVARGLQHNEPLPPAIAYADLQQRLESYAALQKA